MSIITHQYLHCDEPGNGQHWARCPSIELIRDSDLKARNGEPFPGWLRIDDKDYCPRHAKDKT